MFGDLLHQRVDSLQVQMREALSELKTLRQTLIETKSGDVEQLLKAWRMLLSDDLANLLWSGVGSFCQPCTRYS